MQFSLLRKSSFPLFWLSICLLFFFFPIVPLKAAPAPNSKEACESEPKNGLCLDSCVLPRVPDGGCVGENSTQACCVNVTTFPPNSEQACTAKGGTCLDSCTSTQEEKGGCEKDNKSVHCCVEKSTPTSATTTTPKKNTSSGGGPSLYNLLPPQTKACWQTGNCQLDDIVRTGVAFANFLIGLSAAAFFATFIYGGFMYLMSFGSKEFVGKGKKALTGAAIGMIIVMGSWTIVNYLASSIAGRAV
ncbi:hypothetical protein IT408_03625 [Candidatus Uhrbacteria bacterium]|nr:hypothetical protein [Candidatus Uhrbacteria bacterium]